MSWGAGCCSCTSLLATSRATAQAPANPIIELLNWIHNEKMLQGMASEARRTTLSSYCRGCVPAWDAAAAFWHSGPQKKASPQLSQHMGAAKSLPHATHRCPATVPWTRFQFNGRLLHAPLDARRRSKSNGSASAMSKSPDRHFNETFVRINGRSCGIYAYPPEPVTSIRNILLGCGSLPRTPALGPADGTT